MKFLQTLHLIDRTDRLIRLKATGTPTDLANKLTISERSARRLITAMKEMGAPIRYCTYRRSYYYEDSVHFKFGFYCRQGETERLYGGMGKFSGLFSWLSKARSNCGRLLGYRCDDNAVGRNLISWG